MILDKHQSTVKERTLLVALETPEMDRWQVTESLTELASLVRTAGGDVAETAIQKLGHPTAPYYIGKGKAEELSVLCKTDKMEAVVFDDELTPAQSRNLGRVFGLKVVDRTQLILDIFARRAKTKEGKLQIELAQLQYLLPRLTRMWTHLSRQSGGIGTRGPGETQLEVDRRRVQEKIAKLRRDLEEVRRHRSTQRQGRARHDWPVLSLVGYTNAGKSTLFNRLTSAHVLAENKLFATLDPTTRSVDLPGKQRVLMTDTVGFIKKLPHDLIESFKATLEEVGQADLLLHVVDLSHPQYDQQITAVMGVLEELNVADKPVLLVFNKIDQVDNPGLIERVLSFHADSVSVSAETGEGIEELLHVIQRKLASRKVNLHLQIPNYRTEIIALLHREGQVVGLEYRDDQVCLEVLVSPSLEGRLRDYIFNPVTSPKICEMPEEERPRERLLRLGAEPLKNSELLAILLRTGVKGQSVLDLAEHVLAKFGTLEAISRATVAQLAQIKGIGPTKAVQLAASFALGARLSRSHAMVQEMDHPLKVYQLLGDEMRLLQQESVRVMLLNAKYRLMAVEEISRGSLDSVMAHPREVFRPAIARQAYALILIHNHPSGDPSPSISDHHITNQLKKAAEFLEIKLMDHVILGSPRGADSQAYYSFRENGYL